MISGFGLVVRQHSLVRSMGSQTRDHRKRGEDHSPFESTPRDQRTIEVHLLKVLLPTTLPRDQVFTCRLCGSFKIQVAEAPAVFAARIAAMCSMQ